MLTKDVFLRLLIFITRAECELSGVTKTAEEMAEHIKKRIHGNEMDFTFNIPEPGEFLLKIFVVDETDERRQVCLYWLTDADHSKTREVRTIYRRRQAPY